MLSVLNLLMLKMRRYQMFFLILNKDHKNIAFSSVVKARVICFAIVALFGFCFFIMYFQYNADFSLGVPEVFQMTFHLEKDEIEDSLNVLIQEENDNNKSNEQKC